MLGIGITTYNRASRLQTTIEAVQRNTASDHHLVVVDDGSTDHTNLVLDSAGCDYILGSHRGVAWNKNRALYYLKVFKNCDLIILLEDDTFPTANGWERAWIEAGRRLKHANFANSDISPAHFSGGEGTPDNPYLSDEVSAQCAVFHAHILDSVGYMDTRFRGYGYEHAEHTQRIIDTGYGGFVEVDSAPKIYQHFLINSALEITERRVEPPHDEVSRSAAIWDTMRRDPTYRPPWRDNGERAALYAELQSSRDCRRTPSLAGLRLDWILVTHQGCYLCYDPDDMLLRIFTEPKGEVVMVRTNGSHFDFILKSQDGEHLLCPTDNGAFKLSREDISTPHQQMTLSRGRHSTFDLYRGEDRLTFEDEEGAPIGISPQATCHAFEFLRYDCARP